MRIAFIWIMFGALACSSHRDRNDPMVAAAKACAAHADLSCARPILSVKSLRASQAYFRDKLGFKVEWEHGDPPEFGAVSRGDTVLFMCQGCQGAPGSWMMMFAPDVDRLYEEFRKRGAIVRQPPTDMPWGLRELVVADPDGNVMRIGSAREHD